MGRVGRKAVGARQILKDEEAAQREKEKEGMKSGSSKWGAERGRREINAKLKKALRLESFGFEET